MNIRWFAVAVLVLAHLVTELPAALSTNSTPSRAYAVHAWETEDGLPQNSVISMIQTRDGYLWLGTLNGLARFDGIRFTVFDESSTPGLNDSVIVCLFEDSRANLWIGTERAGTVMMKDGRITAPVELSQGGIERKLIAACEDAEGAVWLYLANGDLWRYHRERFTPHVLTLRDPSQPKTIIKETNGPVWVVTSRRQYAIGAVSDSGSLELPIAEEVPAGRLDLLVPSKRSGYWRLANFQVQRWINNQPAGETLRYPWLASGLEIKAACEDQDGNLVVGIGGGGGYWIGTNGVVTSISTTEVVHWITTNGVATPVSTNAFAGAKGLANNTVLSLVVDREGTLWAGTDGGGLNRVKRQHFENVSEIGNWVVTSVCEDQKGGMWIASMENGLGYWKDGTLQRFTAPVGSKVNFVASVFVDRSERVWFGTRGAGLFRFKDVAFQPVVPPGVNLSQVTAMHQDRRGVIWFGTHDGLVSWNEREWKSYGASNGLTSESITAIAEDAHGDLWIGTRRGGLNHLRDGKVSTWRKRDGLPSDDIAALHFDEEGVLWVSTFSSGLGRFHRGRWTRYTKREGLVSNNLGYILDDGDGTLWLGSNAGVLRVRKQALKEYADGTTRSVPCRAYGKTDGLPTLECTSGSQPGAWRTRDGKLWFPTIKGLAVVNPGQLQPNMTPPLVSIDSILVNNVPVTNLSRSAVGPSITLRPGDEPLEIQYSSLNLSAPERARFRYQLEGADKDWTDAGDVRVVWFRQLDPGEYRFHVTACNEDGVWNETGSTLAVIVQPPFWRTWWFYGATAGGLLGLVAGVVHYASTQKLQRQLVKLKQKEALEKERARIARDIHDQVGASLTQVALLGELVETDKNLPDEVEAHAKQISQTARETTHALDEIVWTVNPSNDTLEGLVNYICKHAQDFLRVAGLRYRLEVPERLPALSMSPEVRHNVFLASKEAVTNVVRHAKATAAWIRLRVDSSSFTVEIEDNGCGIADPNAPTVRNGLRNMRKRMDDIGGRFSISRGKEGGALVQLTVPITSNNVAPVTNSK